ncbi:MAG TPA: acetylxylan esterase [Peptococcaceae bacterium]|nr:acetylxylan esterase [Peptococcaceae bacterium]
MGILEKKVAELKNYKPELTRQQDFERFWLMAAEEIFSPEGLSSWRIDPEEREISEEFQVSFNLELEDINYPLKQVKVYKASLEAAEGTTLHGWYLYPATAGEHKKVPGLIRFHGYSSNKGKICELLLWALQGYAVLAMDVRGQCGDTPDARVYSSGSFSGWLTLGLDSPLEYYYRQVYLDSIQAIEALARRPEVDGKKIGLFGNSQGGALAIVSAALLSRFAGKLEGITAQVAAVSAGIPFLSDLRRAYEEHVDGPLTELDWYFRMYDPLHEREEEIFKLLSYFDAMNFAPWVKCPALVSIGLKDTACPPPTIYALFNHLGGKKEILIYPDYSHESNDNFLDRQIVFFARELLGM